MSFDTLAPHYRWMEIVMAGTLLEQCRTRHLHALSQARRLLVLGPGRSTFTRAVLVASPAVHLTLVDSSRGMLSRLERDLRSSVGDAAKRVTFVQADVRTWAPEGPPFDGVATHFFLDCFAPEELALLVERVAGWLAADAAWILADFRIPERGWGRSRARLIHALMYGFFRRTTPISARRITPPDQLLRAAGFHLEDRHTRSVGLLHSDLWRRGPAFPSDATRARPGPLSVPS